MGYMRQETKIKEVLLQHLIIDDEDPTKRVYDWAAAPAIKAMFEDEERICSVYVYPVPAFKHTDPDFWCAVSWNEGDHITTFGFNYMSQVQQRKYTVFNAAHREGLI